MVNLSKFPLSKPKDIKSTRDQLNVSISDSMEQSLHSTPTCKGRSFSDDTNSSILSITDSIMELLERWEFVAYFLGSSPNRTVMYVAP